MDGFCYRHCELHPQSGLEPNLGSPLESAQHFKISVFILALFLAPIFFFLISHLNTFCYIFGIIPLNLPRRPLETGEDKRHPHLGIQATELLVRESPWEGVGMIPGSCPPSQVSPLKGPLRLSICMWLCETLMGGGSCWGNLRNYREAVEESSHLAVTEPLWILARGCRSMTSGRCLPLC